MIFKTTIFICKFHNLHIRNSSIMEDKSTERFVRWQEKTSKHFEYTINTLLLIATATLGFTLSKFLDKMYQGCERPFFLIGILFLVISIGLLLWTILNRLMDFRLTTQVAGRDANSNDRTEMREKSSSLGKCTWILFYVAIIIFGLGLILTIIAFGIIIIY